MSNSVRKIFLYAALFLVCFCAFLPINAQQTIGFRITSSEGKSEIPFTVRNNLIIVSVIFQNILPLRFIVDTGVRNTVLMDRTYSNMLQIEPDRMISLIGAAGGRSVNAFIAHKISIDLPGVKGDNLSILILEEDYLGLGQMLGMEIHGILGYDLFKNFQVELDYENQLMTIAEPGKIKGLRSFKELPMVIEDTKPYITAAIETKDSRKINAKLMIDTGASHAVMLHPNSDEEINLPKKRIRELIGVGLGGDIEGYMGRIQKVKFNIPKYELTNVITAFPDRGSYSDVVETTGRNGTIGGMLLKRFKVVFDYPNEKIYLRKIDLKSKFRYDMSGLTVVAEGIFYNTLVIKKVRENSPADLAGLQPGDQIIKFNGSQAVFLDINMVNNAFRKGNGRRVWMTVLRNEEKIKVKFRLQEMI